jgi:hypothetical protein
MVVPDYGGHFLGEMPFVRDCLAQHGVVDREHSFFQVNVGQDPSNSMSGT